MLRSLCREQEYSFGTADTTVRRWFLFFFSFFLNCCSLRVPALQGCLQFSNGSFLPLPVPSGYSLSNAPSPSPSQDLLHPFFCSGCSRHSFFWLFLFGFFSLFSPFFRIFFFLKKQTTKCPFFRDALDTTFNLLLYIHKYHQSSSGFFSFSSPGPLISAVKY